MTDSTATHSEAPWSRGGSCSGMRWRPLEIVAVVAGFAIYWPLGFAVLAWKLAKRSGYPMPDVVGMARSGFNDLRSGFNPGSRQAWRPFSQPSSGNAAFDDWRRAEMEKLDEERRKLDAAQRDFAEHLDKLRTAKDREEFEHFMASRRTSSGPHH